MTETTEIENFKLITSLNEFSLKLFRKLSKEKDANLVISPFSISTCLSMCYVGAKNETAKQLKELLSLTELSDEEILELNKEYLESINSILDSDMILNTANKLYPNEQFEIKKEFTDKIQKFFNSDIEKLDFNNADESAHKINEWVEEKTNHKIKNIVSSKELSDQTKLILINAIHFKSRWMREFQEYLTKKDSFFLEDGSTQEVDMMGLERKHFKIMINPNDLRASVCELPYYHNKASFIVILPDKNVKLEEIENQLNSNLLNHILRDQPGTRMVNLFLPKFKFENKTELTDHLISLGAQLAFDFSNSDFSGISESESGPLYISKVIHQTMIDVNEKGTEAAAATVSTMLLGASMHLDEPYEFRCDRPFLFIIQDKIKNGILFMGKYIKPN